VNWFKKLSQAKAYPPSGCRPPLRKTVTATPPFVKPESNKTSKSTTSLPIQSEKSPNVLEKKNTPTKESSPPVQNTQPATQPAAIRTPLSKNITVIEILDSSDDESEVKKNESPVLNNNHSNGIDRKNNNEKGRSSSSPVPIFYFKPEPLTLASQLQAPLPMSGKEMNSDNNDLLEEVNEDFYYSQEVLYFEDDNNNQSFVYAVRKYNFALLYFLLISSWNNFLF
jgi:hypothetical protein